MNGKKARSIRRAVYGAMTFRNRSYVQRGSSKQVALGPIGNSTRRRVGFSGGTIESDAMRQMYQYAKKMHKSGAVTQRTL